MTAANLCREAVEAPLSKLTEDLPLDPRPINLSLSQFLKDGCIGETDGISMQKT